jgi:hypothetical protein
MEKPEGSFTMGMETCIGFATATRHQETKGENEEGRIIPPFSRLTAPTDKAGAVGASPES